MNTTGPSATASRPGITIGTRKIIWLAVRRLEAYIETVALPGTHVRV